MRKLLCACAIPLLLLVSGSVPSGAKGVEVGIDEQLGAIVPLDSMTVFDEDGNEVSLRSLVDRPVALTLVYYRCPGICTPLLQEMAKNVDLSTMQVGEDFRILTISFDPAEADNPDLGRNKKANLLATLEHKQVPEDGWRFLTASEETIERLTDAVGFRYQRDQNGADFVHAATVILLSKEGKIVRYLNGTRFNPADLELAVVDASEGRARSFMQRMQRLCYAYDPAGRSYVLKINRIILGVTLLFAVAFGVFLFSKSLTRKVARSQTTTGSAS